MSPEYIQSTFSTKDLALLSGIKAHTIRMWEKRYHLFAPDRTQTNIRNYDLNELKKLLNIAYLVRQGYRISTVAEFTEQQIQKQVEKEVAKKQSGDYHQEALLMATLGYDVAAFQGVLKKLLQQDSFEQVYGQILLPFIQTIGMLWHAGTLDLTHEHFATQMIQRQLLLNTAALDAVPKRTDTPFFVLFLPYNEIHALGLELAQYLILKRGMDVLMLGPSVPLDGLVKFTSSAQKVIFLSFFTVRPAAPDLELYVKQAKKLLLEQNSHALWVLGARASEIPNVLCSAQLLKFTTIPSFIRALDAL
ncbi:MAG: MerR family transcriptional regulator [Flavobacteriaceae bacterium]